MASISIESNGLKAGDSPILLQEMLQYLGHQEEPMYRGFMEVVNGREEWRVEVLVIHTQKHKKPLIIEASGRRSSFDAGIRDAACQAIFRVRDMYTEDLSHNTPYLFFPRRRICNTEKEIPHYYHNKKHQQHDSAMLIQMQIRLTMAIVAACDDAWEELREERCKVRELEEELKKQQSPAPAPAPRHCKQHKAAITIAASPSPRRRVIVGDRKRYPGSPGHNKVVTAPAPAARTRTGVVVGGNTNRPRACLSLLQRKQQPGAASPTRSRSRGGAAPPPSGRLARGGVVKEENSGVSLGGSGFSALQLVPPPIACTQKSLLMHSPAQVEVAVEGPPRRGSSSSFERRMHGSNLVAIILDGGVALGKEPAIANANNSDDATATTTSAPRLLWENMEKQLCSSARRRRLL